ncbi:hypothetical protein B0A55_03234 [Friedmanniomyces simplex]|uniref:Uncharacterized protein n=1 Tax=Friedmanniomyces simplex TaxID=329884 RepID=A0A4U0XJN0_9PEZI|nr:hypothetical protein B0A55_03234 [Friedmanniomyces simplex]
MTGGVNQVNTLVVKVTALSSAVPEPLKIEILVAISQIAAAVQDITEKSKNKDKIIADHVSTNRGLRSTIAQQKNLIKQRNAHITKLKACKYHSLYWQCSSLTSSLSRRTYEHRACTGSLLEQISGPATETGTKRQSDDQHTAEPVKVQKLDGAKSYFEQLLDGCREKSIKAEQIKLESEEPSKSMMPSEPSSPKHIVQQRTTSPEQGPQTTDAPAEVEPLSEWQRRFQALFQNGPSSKAGRMDGA